MAKGKTGKKEKKIRYFDYNLLFLLIFLICFGLVMLYSASSYSASINYSNSAYYVKKQIIFYGIGTVVMIVMASIPYTFWKRWATIIYAVAIALCVVILIPGVGRSSHGQSRWIQVGPIGFQPSEAAKIAVIIFLAMMFERTYSKMGDFRTLIKLFLLVLPVVGPIAWNNLSTAVIIMGIAFCMAFVASPKYSHFAVVLLAGVAFILLFIFGASYRGDRVNAWLHPETAGDDGFQTLQGLYAIGSGGLFGKGLGESMQKFIVPEAQNDMIFSIICEELGLFGGVCIIVLYGLFLWRMLVICNNANDLFGALLVTGVMSHIAIQVILNIAVVTNTIPNTGVTLPFFSYGGSSVMFLMLEMGLVISVSRGIVLDEIK
ncbi:MAG: putative lipid II flippase FtsW [Agathobacter sp.]|nr:putative lipid II flippase FtsW [Agathobacter sp.]